MNNFTLHCTDFAVVDVILLMQLSASQTSNSINAGSKSKSSKEWNED
jgi:hypothetical protein